MTYNRFIQGLKARRCRGRPQDPGRPGRQRRAGLRRARRDRQGRPARGRQRPGDGLTASHVSIGSSRRLTGVVRRWRASLPSLTPPLREERPRQDGTEARPSQFPGRAPAVPRRGPQGVDRGPARPAASSRSSPRRRPASSTPRCARPSTTPGSPGSLVDERRRRPRSAAPSAPQGVVAVCRFLDVPARRGPGRRAPLVAVCADVRDPGNAGTVIRCADAAGADAVVLAGHSVDPYNAKTVRASVGSLFHLPLSRRRRPRRGRSAGRRPPGSRVLAADGAGEIDLVRGRASGLLAGRARGCSATRPGGCPTSSRRWPTTGSRSRSTAGPRASTWPPRPRSASTPAPARDGPSAPGAPTRAHRATPVGPDRHPTLANWHCARATFAHDHHRHLHRAPGARGQPPGPGRLGALPARMGRDQRGLRLRPVGRHRVGPRPRDRLRRPRPGPRGGRPAGSASCSWAAS